MASGQVAKQVPAEQPELLDIEEALDFVERVVDAFKKNGEVESVLWRIGNVPPSFVR